MRRVVWILTSLVVALAAPASAQSYEIAWSSVDAGGTTSASGAGYRLAGTVGQADAAGPLAGAAYVVQSGFWAVAVEDAAAQADLSITASDGQTTAVPGQSVTYAIVVGNAGPSAVVGASVAAASVPPLAGAAWTCAASPGSSCPSSGSGPIAQAVSLLSGGSATFTLTGNIDPAATGTLVLTASVAAPAGVGDPVASNNAATDTDVLSARADLALTLADAPDPVGPGGLLTYTVRVTNDGPSVSPGMTVSHTLPAAVTFVSATPGSPACAHAGGVVTCSLGGLAPAAGTTVAVSASVSLNAVGTLTSTARVTGAATDPVGANDADTQTTSVLSVPPEGEVAHGSRLQGDLAPPGGIPDVDLFRVRQEPFASYEVVVDAASGDVGTGAGPALDRVAANGTTVLQSASPIGTGAGRSLRFANATSAAIEDELVRVRSRGCQTTCGPDDTYRLRAWETTYAVARFNDAGSQFTVLIVQNPTAQPVDVTVLFWSADGSLLGTYVQSTPVPARGQLVLPTWLVPGVAGASGSMTVVHDAPYGALAGKAIAIELKTGFVVESLMEPRPR
ncbi:MAG: DUF11 domain-containing protein [Vicinamibacteria bacterium]